MADRPHHPLRNSAMPAAWVVAASLALLLIMAGLRGVLIDVLQALFFWWQ